MSPVRWIRADNPSPLTLDGTRTYVLGETRVVVIDPGPARPEHLHAIAQAAGDGASATILITHTHPDHAEGAPRLARELGAEIVHPSDGQAIDTDEGELLAVATPGHTADHMSFFLAERRIVFCGDLMTGGMDTALVAPPEGDLRDYLHSLERIRALDPTIIYPAHGPAFEQPQSAIDRYLQHRMERVEQVLAALAGGPATAENLVERVYGAQLDSRLRRYAESAVEAYLTYLAAGGRAELSSNGEWSLA